LLAVRLRDGLLLDLVAQLLPRLRLGFRRDAELMADAPAGLAAARAEYDCASIPGPPYRLAALEAHPSCAAHAHLPIVTSSPRWLRAEA
jgi:hypothetical protein